MAKSNIQNISTFVTKVMILCDQTSDFIIYFDKVCQSYCYYSELYHLFISTSDVSPPPSVAAAPGGGQWGLQKTLEKTQRLRELRDPAPQVQPGETHGGHI